MEQHIVRTSLFGVNLTLKVDEDPEHVSRVIDYIEQKGHEVRRNMIETDPHRISVIINLLLADELLSSRISNDSSKGDTQQVDRLAQELIQLINEKIEE